MTQVIWQRVAEVAKAIVAAGCSAIAYVLAVGGFEAMTQRNWLELVLWVAGSFGITWAVPNRPKAA